MKPENTKENFLMSERGERAMKLFEEGYNCAQSVFLAFSDQYGMSEKMAAMMSSSFGAGMGRLREVCGAVSGMFMVAGVRYGYSDPEATEEKKKHYARIQKLAAQYEELNGSIVCRELLGLSCRKQEPTPEARTEEYYKKRPCKQLVGMAATLMEQMEAEEEQK
ncbi:MAG: C-GCAxxG-C-C family protein [Hespellia sp.]|nr:C-GCAxxG-C-C family protein [Hespellia sp.]